MPFDYTLSHKIPNPLGRPHPPLGPTIIEVMRSCPLRSCFEASPSYELRMGISARISTALHRTLQSFYDQPIQAETNEQLAAETHRRFNVELHRQQAQSAEHPRERGLPWNANRISNALQAVIAEAIRTQPLGLTSSKPYFAPASSSAQQNTSLPEPSYTPPLSPPPPVEVEIPVHSSDNLFSGRVDRAEHTEFGTRLIDYKSANREDLPGRYARQLQLYAFMWHETRGEWPIDAQVFYPLRGVFYPVPVDAATCQQVAIESATLIENTTHETNSFKLATPGDTCKICEFRPWCQPFWKWQASETNHRQALDKAAFGFEGQLLSIDLINFYWHLKIAWRNAKIRLVAPQERFPHLANAYPGQKVIVLDTALRNQLYSPDGVIKEISEIFLIRD